MSHKIQGWEKNWVSGIKKAYLNVHRLTLLICTLVIIILVLFSVTPLKFSFFYHRLPNFEKTSDFILLPNFMCTSTKLPLFLFLLKFPSKILLASLDQVVTIWPKVANPTWVRWESVRWRDGWVSRKKISAFRCKKVRCLPWSLTTGAPPIHSDSWVLLLEVYNLRLVINNNTDRASSFHQSGGNIIQCPVTAFCAQPSG